MDTCSGYNMSRKRLDPNGSQRTGSSNYYGPLQTIADEDNDEVVVEHTVKEKIPPITILKCNMEKIQEACRISHVKDYSMRKISIGIKLFLTNNDDYNKMCEVLSKNLQLEYFSYASKNEKPFKAVLLGLDKMDPTVVKSKLLILGLKCLDVKIVTIDRENRNQQVIYIVYFERKTITMRELRQNYSAIDYIKVRWEHQKPNKSKVTQCYNCQMFGHGASKCRVKMYCALCAGNHKTTDCKEQKFKCANCNGDHKALSPECPKREEYKQIRQRTQPRNRLRSQQFNTASNYDVNFPNSLNQNQRSNTNRMGYNQPNYQNTNNNTGNLFSFEEIKNLTFELISSLRNCKSREEQFGVITNLACKFLYQ